MKKTLTIILLALLFISIPTTAKSATVYDVILDEDFSTDVDDVVSARLATSLSCGYINLVAFGLSTSGYNAPRAAHGLLSYDGFSNIPIGINTESNIQENCYWGELWKYGSDSTLIQQNAVALYKECLNNTQSSVRIITTGYLYNISNLLKDKEGYELVKNHCDSIWITGGSWMNGCDNNFTQCNSADDIQYVINNSSVPIYFCTSNTWTAPINNTHWGVLTGNTLITNKPNDPVSKSLIAWGNENNFNMSGGYYSADAMCVFCACMPTTISLMKFTPCNIYIAPNGCNTFSFNIKSNCYVIERTNDNLNYYKNQINYYIDKDYLNP